MPGGTNATATGCTDVFAVLAATPLFALGRGGRSPGAAHASSRDGAGRSARCTGQPRSEALPPLSSSARSCSPSHCRAWVARTPIEARTSRGIRAPARHSAAYPPNHGKHPSIEGGENRIMCHIAQICSSRVDPHEWPPFEAADLVARHPRRALSSDAHPAGLAWSRTNSNSNGGN